MAFLSPLCRSRCLARHGGPLMDDQRESKERCPHTWGLIDRVRCLRRAGHEGMHSGMTDAGKMVW